MNSDPFISARRRINRAKHHLKTLDVETKAFWKRDPFEFIADLQADGLSKIYKCRLIEPVPEDFDWLAIEAVEHLRAALDQIAFATATLAGHVESKRAYFPIADTAEMLNKDVIGRGRCKDVPPDVLAVFRGFKPYKAGNKPIWALNKVCNASKHKCITSVELAGGPNSFHPSNLPHGSVLLSNRWDSSKNEIEYFSIPVNMEPDHDYDVSFFIAFGNVPELAGKPVVPIIDSFGKAVSRVLAVTEHKCHEIGLIP